MLLFLGIILLNCADEKRKNTLPLCSNKDFEFIVNRDTVNKVEELVAVSKRLKKEQKLGDISSLMFTDYSQCECTDSTLLVSTRGVFVFLVYYRLSNDIWQSMDTKPLYAPGDVYLRGAYKDGEEVIDHQIFLEPGNKVKAVHTTKKMSRSKRTFVDISKTESNITLDLDEGKIQWPASERQ